MPELTGWIIRDELVWYEERHYSGNQSLSYMEQDERAQVVLTLQGELLARLVSSTLIPPGSPSLKIGELRQLNESDIAEFDYLRHRRPFRRRDKTYRAEGWSLHRGRQNHTELGKGLSIELTRLRRSLLGR